MFDMSRRRYRLDVCPVCRASEEVSSKKKVYPCSYCERWFCKKHLEPKVSVFSPTQVTIKDLAWKDFIRRNWKNKDGHPDYVYTKEKMEELGEGEWSRDTSSLTGTSADCPQCGSERSRTTASRDQYDAFECLDCGYGWKRFHRVSAKRLKRKKRMSIMRIAFLVTFMVILVVIILNGSIIFSALQNFMQRSEYTKVVVVRGQVAKVEFDGNEYSFVYTRNQVTVLTPLYEFRYYGTVEGAIYSDLGIEIVVSEVYSDYIVLLVKPRY